MYYKKKARSFTNKMGLIDINSMFERVKEVPLNCPQCKGELVEIKLSIYDQLLERCFVKKGSN